MTTFIFDIYKALNYLAIVGLLLNFVQNFFIPVWSSILNGVFKIFLLIFLITVEFNQRPAFIKYWSFMYTFLGRSFFYILLSLITMSLFLLGLIGSLLASVNDHGAILFVGVVYFVLHLALPGKEPNHMSYSTYQSIIVRGNTPIIGSRPAQMKQTTSGSPLPTTHIQQYQFAPQKLLPEHQATPVVPDTTNSPEPQEVQPTPLESIVVTNESKKAEVP